MWFTWKETDPARNGTKRHETVSVGYPLECLQTKVNKGATTHWNIDISNNV